MSLAAARAMTVRLLAWTVTGMLIAATVCALAVVGTSTALKHRGMQVAVVLSGSMTPTFQAGDAVIIQPKPAPEDLRVGHVIMYRSPGEAHGLTTHRIAALIQRKDGLWVQTKGDANRTPDANFTHASDVVGIMGSAIPHGGKAVSFYTSPRGRAVVLGVPLAILFIAQALHLARTLRGRDDDPDRPSDPGSTGPRPDPRRARRFRQFRRFAPTRTRTAGAALAAAAAIGITTASTGATFASTTGTSTGTFTTASSFCGPTSDYAALVQADHPDLYWRHESLDTDTGAQAAGTVTYGGPGAVPCSTSARFDSAGALSTTSKTNPGTDFTIETWVRSTGSPAAQLVGLGDKRAGSGPSGVHDPVLYLTSAGRAAFTVGDAATRTTLTTAGTVTDGTWHHLAVTYTPGSARLYLDGTLVAAQANPAPVASTRGLYWRVGQDTITGLPGVTGSPTGAPVASLDETAIYPAALPVTRVAAHAAAGR